MTSTLMAARFTLRELLEKHDIGQAEMSRDSGVSIATINRLCTNATAQVSLETLDRLLGALWSRGIDDADVTDIITVAPDRKRRRGP